MNTPKESNNYEPPRMIMRDFDEQGCESILATFRWTLLTQQTSDILGL